MDHLLMVLLMLWSSVGQDCRPMMTSIRRRTGSLNMLHFLLGVLMFRPEGAVSLELLPSTLPNLENTNVTVVCSGQGQVTWHSPSGSQLDSGTSISVLRLFNATWRDSGRYTCVEESSYEEREIDIFIPGQGPDEWFVPQDESFVMKEEGEESTISCVVSDPRLNVSLHETPGRTPVTGTTYEPGRGFTGHLTDTSYVCLAARGDEERESQEYNVVTIKGPEKPQVTVTASSSVLKQGEALTVHCTVKGGELFFFSWDFPRRQDIEPLTDVVSIDQTRSIINIPKATVADSGNYVCKVKTVIDDQTVTANITVTVLGPPAEGHTSTGSQCETTAKVDIMLVVDGFWRMSSSTFQDMKNFLKRIVGTFDIGPDRVQIGLVQYNHDKWTEWHLNSHQTNYPLLRAIDRLHQEDGGTMTGRALKSVLHEYLHPRAGMRADSVKIVVLITDGPSDDDVLLPSQSLKDAGVEIYAIGLHVGLETELRSIASDPKETHMYSVNDFPFFHDFIIHLCNSTHRLDLLLDGSPPPVHVGHDPVHISRLVVLPLALLLIAVCVIHKVTRAKKLGPQENMELDYINLGAGGAEGGPAEEGGAWAEE